MEGSNNNETYNYSKYSSNILDVLIWINVCSGLPLTLLAIVALYSLIKTDHSAPVYVINLLISDVIQLCCMVAWNAGKHGKVHEKMLSSAYFFGVMTSVGFMVCLSIERYLVIARPLWYKFRRNIKTSVVACVVVWTLPLVYVLPAYLNVDFLVPASILAVFLLLPLPLFILSLVGTLRALSAARSVPTDEKRRIVAILVVVLLIYMLLFLPSVVWFLLKEFRENVGFYNVTFFLLSCSPLADLSMYIFIRKGATDKVLASLCCCEMDSSDNDSMSASGNQTV